MRWWRRRNGPLGSQGDRGIDLILIVAGEVGSNGDEVTLLD
jgi:hypothetical protein